MTTFTVHEPPPRKNEETASPVRFAFVRDGFYFWAFLLGPVWMLYHRLWLVLLMYLAGTTAIQAALWALGVSGLVKFTVGLLIAPLDQSRHRGRIQSRSHRASFLRPLVRQSAGNRCAARAACVAAGRPGADL